MPVRIYDIAKKVGVESKMVLAKAKELGISTARVPSSTLDKITAEYLLEQLGYHPQPPAPPQAPVATPEAAAPAPPPAEAPPPAAPVIISAAAPEAGVAPPSPPAATPGTVGLPPAVPAEVPSSAPLTAPPIPAVPAVAVPQPGGGVPPETGAPALAEAPAGPLPLPVSGAVAGAPATVIEDAVSLPAAAPAAPPPAPPVPPPPPKPGLGEKIGFIQLPQKPRPPERVAAGGRAAPPGRPEPPRGGRDQRSGPTIIRGPRDVRPPAPPVAKVGVGARPGPPARPAPAPVPELLTGDEILVKPPVTVRDLADVIKRKPFQVIADLMELGIFANVNQSLEPEVAQRIAAKHGVRLRVRKREEGGGVTHRPEPKKEASDPEDKTEDLKPRAPVVTIMGHVDHGKTTLLDVIRKSNVAAGEAGGITQHIGAYTISVPHPERKGELQQITFLDTPGHAAFSAMRARGANVTDIVILVVAANDGVMPQTLEALSHAQAAKVPIIVAVNKCDHPNANPMKVRQQLQDKGLTPDEWGGDTFFVDVSALTQQGVDKLLEMICFQADLLDLRANPSRRAKGNVIESGLEPGGPTATVLVRKGTLKLGDIIICDVHYGKVRALISEDGKRLKEAGPSVAVKVLGLNGVPEAGVEFLVVENDKLARELTEQRQQAAKSEERDKRPRMTLEGLFDALEGESAKVLRVVVKADAQGSVEAIVDALQQIETEKVSLDIIHAGVGTVTERDITLASASKAVVLGFHARVDNAAAELAKREGVQIRLYAIIYELIDQVKDAMAGLLDPLLKEVVFGSAEVRKIFELSKGGNVAGCYVTSGRIVRGKARVVRRKNHIYEGLINTLRRFQDEVNEVRAGMECGVRLDGFDEFQEGDTIECYSIEKVAQKL